MSTDYATATNGTASIVYAAPASGSGIRHYFDEIHFSLSADPSSAVAITIQEVASIKYSIDVLKGGAGFLKIGYRASPGNSLTVSLGAGGSSVVGKIAVVGKGTL